MSPELPKPKLLFLGSAFPPGVAGLFPDAQPAGHAMQTQMVGALEKHFEIRAAGVFSFPVEGLELPPHPVPGVPLEVALLDRSPEVWHRWRSIVKLKQTYRQLRRQGWNPDAVLLVNMSPIYNAFVLWLKRQSPRPRLVLLLSDSAYLREQPRWTKRFRRAFKPFVWAEKDMVPRFDACIALSKGTEDFFTSRGIPWMWMPGGCLAERAITTGPDKITGPIRFGYFGAFAGHAGLPDLIKVFTATDRPHRLRICGWGKAESAIGKLCAGDSRLEFLGVLPSPEDCLRFAQGCDVLVNPRPTGRGNENNFPSKIFEYALSARAILTTRLSGVDTVLGREAFYLNEADFERSLGAMLDEVAMVPREELNRRGQALCAQVISHFNWARGAERMAAFVSGLAQPDSRRRNLIAAT